MSQAVIIKSNQYGINLILDPDVPFQELVDAVIEKFQEAEKFFKNAKLGISFEGRKLTSEEECRIIEAITEHTSIQILCIIDNDEHSAEETKKKIDEFLRLQQQYAVNVEAQGEFYKGTLRSGQNLETDGNVTILGDVNPGAKVTAGGNIVILGALKGNVHAGALGNRNCFIFALDMNPIQVQIDNLIAKRPDKPKGRRFLPVKKEKEQAPEPQIAVARDNAIYIETVIKRILI